MNLNDTKILMVIMSVICMLLQVHGQAVLQSLSESNLSRKTYQKINQFGDVDDRKFLLEESLKVGDQGGKVSYESLQISSRQGNWEISVLAVNIAYIYSCNSQMRNCKFLTKISITPSNINLYTSALSGEKSIMVLGGSRPDLYIYQRKSNSSDYSQVGPSLQFFTNEIKAVRMTLNGSMIVAGGSGKTPRIYTYNQSSQNLYTLTQNMTNSNITSSILHISLLDVPQGYSYIFAAYSSFVSVNTKNSTGQYVYNYTLGSDLEQGDISAMAVPPKITNQLGSIMATGSFKMVRIYQCLQSSMKLESIQNISQGINNVLSLAFSDQGDYLVIGNHASTRYVYKKNVMDSGKFHYELFQTLKISDGPSDFAKRVQIKPDASGLVTANDDFTLRVYNRGQCGDGQFQEDGNCLEKSYALIYVGIGIGAIVILGLVVAVWIKRVRIPDENKERLHQKEYLEEDYKRKETPNFRNQGK